MIFFFFLHLRIGYFEKKENNPNMMWDFIISIFKNAFLKSSFHL